MAGTAGQVWTGQKDRAGSLLGVEHTRRDLGQGGLSGMHVLSPCTGLERAWESACWGRTPMALIRQVFYHSYSKGHGPHSLRVNEHRRDCPREAKEPQSQKQEIRPSAWEHTGPCAGRRLGKMILRPAAWESQAPRSEES
jgi:hypothetical protein